MIILPAIDLKDGRCVRLVKGDYATAHQVASDPLSAAEDFKRAGAAWIHMVDLDGAKDGRPVNEKIFEEIAARSGLKVEAGGGIRSMETVEAFIERGISRVILGSAALTNPALVKEAVKEFGEKIAVGIDARDGYVATEGWLLKSQVAYTELAKAMEDAGVETIIYTDISRDGTLSGVNIEQLKTLKDTVSCRIIASGGVRSMQDIEDCISLDLYGCICGKAVYTGDLSLFDAVQKAGEQKC